MLDEDKIREFDKLTKSQKKDKLIAYTGGIKKTTEEINTSEDDFYKIYSKKVEDITDFLKFTSLGSMKHQQKLEYNKELSNLITDKKDSKKDLIKSLEQIYSLCADCLQDIQKSIDDEPKI